ncbi:MarR family winged helix-turn-helix transcriptional regulator [Novosphingobium sp.]|uniref:MarR family winged helix-turn-helix transcriptional regulator n=1 Tax=Novosphingobium sp. TaxID=1874826 RepID=UPI002602819A|nr:MarR family winged helix-turn-helix transcriptional regulator [Novosphingobium sp.]
MLILTDGQRVTQATNLRQRARKLITFANGLLSIARDLEAFATRSEWSLPDINAATDDNDSAQDHPYWLELARRAYSDRRRRSKYFDASLFGEPAWDLLLDLFIAEKEGRRVSVTSACIGAAVPSTTALRWILVLENEDLVWRENDPKDARRAFLHLTAKAYTQMIEYLSTTVPASIDDSEKLFA